MADQIELNIGKDLQAIPRERHDRGRCHRPGAAPADVRGRRREARSGIACRCLSDGQAARRPSRLQARWPKICVMGQDISIATLRSRVSALVEQESVLLTQAFELSRGGGDRRAHALFAQVQAMQVERNSEETDRAGAGRAAPARGSRIWKLGVYDYRRVVGGDPVRVHVTQGPLGLQALLPGQRPGAIESLRGLSMARSGADDGPPAVEREAVAQNAHAGTPAQAK